VLTFNSTYIVETSRGSHEVEETLVIEEIGKERGDGGKVTDEARDF